MHDYGVSGMGIGMGVVWLVPLLLIVAFIYFIIGNKKEDLSARDILDKRYANGEIDEDEYKRKRDELK